MMMNGLKYSNQGAFGTSNMTSLNIKLDKFLQNDHIYVSGSSQEIETTPDV